MWAIQQATCLLVLWVFMDEAIIECQHVFVRMAVIASCMSSGALGFLWMQLPSDAYMFSCVWLSLDVGYSASFLSSGALGFLWMQLSLRATYLVPFGFLMDAAIIGCRQGFIHMAFIGESCQGQRATSTASFSVSLPYYIVRWFSLLYHLLDTSFYLHLQRQGNKFYTFWCHQFVSRLIVVLVVDNPFNGYPATHACYRWIISATNKKQQ
ncbi:hypothetical protein O0I10_002183 [Lichtheimia ornata]|uniref:Uncharacterized protein n=1 Tax=Lichtheimia ornata TaxID=688661 RepID=A0AAD7V9G7_9FUNG|nr:uncharacterized protein O0I10_002183 [Lichtheimia ornata]KAJ8661854.1 hypothetical protein O0I10_002183 [Lichtheimia ornata]